MKLPPSNVEWYTPSFIIEKARRVMGSIDVDPASCDLANKVVKAKKYYTKENDGLLKLWEGNVFMNPPYRKGIVSKFSKHFVNNYPFISQAIILTSNFFEVSHQQELLKLANVVCFIKGRTDFYSYVKTNTKPRWGNSIYGFKVDISLFIEEFKELGVCFIKGGKING